MSGETPNRVISALKPDLSPHEARIVALVAEGWRNHVIAAQLDLQELADVAAAALSA